MDLMGSSRLRCSGCRCYPATGIKSIKSAPFSMVSRPELSFDGFDGPMLWMPMLWMPMLWIPMLWMPMLWMPMLPRDRDQKQQAQQI